jgi:hypothetical protein
MVLKIAVVAAMMIAVESEPPKQIAPPLKFSVADGQIEVQWPEYRARAAFVEVDSAKGELKLAGAGDSDVILDRTSPSHARERIVAHKIKFYFANQAIKAQSKPAQ